MTRPKSQPMLVSMLHLNKRLITKPDFVYPLFVKSALRSEVVFSTQAKVVPRPGVLLFRSKCVTATDAIGSERGGPVQKPLRK